MRPLFGVVLVPSTPINDEGSPRPDPSGSLAPAPAASAPCAVNEMILRRLRDAKNHARILHREKALGHDHVEEERQHQRATVTSRVAVWCFRTNSASPVKLDDPVEEISP